MRCAAGIRSNSAGFCVPCKAGGAACLLCHSGRMPCFRFRWVIRSPARFWSAICYGSQLCRLSRKKNASALLNWGVAGLKAREISPFRHEKLLTFPFPMLE